MDCCVIAVNVTPTDNSLTYTHALLIPTYLTSGYKLKHLTLNEA